MMNTPGELSGPTRARVVGSAEPVDFATYGVEAEVPPKIGS